MMTSKDKPLATPKYHHRRASVLLPQHHGAPWTNYLSAPSGKCASCMEGKPHFRGRRSSIVQVLG